MSETQKKTTVEIPADLWRSAKVRALDDETDFRTVVIRALEAYLGEVKKSAKAGKASKK